MTSIRDLPSELVQRIVSDSLDLSWDSRDCKRNEIGTFNACVEHELSRVHLDDWEMWHRSALKLTVLFQILDGQSGDGKMMICTRSEGLECVAIAAYDLVTADMLDHTVRAQCSRATVTELLVRGLLLEYTDFMSIRERSFAGQRYHADLSPDEAQRMATLGAAHIGNLDMLKDLFEHSLFDTTATSIRVSFGPLAISVHKHVDALKARWALHENEREQDGEGSVSTEKALRSTYQVPRRERKSKVSLSLDPVTGCGYSVLYIPPVSQPSVDINRAADPWNVTPIMAAAAGGQIEALKYLFDVSDSDNRTGRLDSFNRALSGVIADGSKHVIVPLLRLSGSPITAPNHLESLLCEAMYQERLEMVRLLVENGKVSSEADFAANYYQCLCSVVREGRWDFFEYLLSIEGVPIRAPNDHRGVGLLALAVNCEEDGVLTTLLKKDIDPVERLEAFIYAARKRNFESMQIVLDAGGFDLDLWMHCRPFSKSGKLAYPIVLEFLATKKRLPVNESPSVSA